MRCRGCDSLIYYTPVVWGVVQTEEGEKVVLLDDDGLCISCMSGAFSQYSYAYDHEFAFEDIKEGLTPPILDCEW